MAEFSPKGLNGRFEKTMSGQPSLVPARAAVKCKQLYLRDGKGIQAPCKILLVGHNRFISFLRKELSLA